MAKLLEKKLLEVARAFDRLDDYVASDSEVGELLDKYADLAEEFEMTDEWKIGQGAFYLLQAKIMAAQDYVEKYKAHMEGRMRQSPPSRRRSPRSKGAGPEEGAGTCRVIPFPGPSYD